MGKQITGQNVAYRRVSTLIQNEERQLEGMEFDEEFTDKASGRDKKRPELERCLKHLRKGDTLHVHSIDRLGRNLSDLLSIVDELVNRDVAVKFYKEGLVFGDGNSIAMSKLMLQVMGACAEFELSMINERRREGQQLAKKKGKHIGRKSTLNESHTEQVKAMWADGLNKKQIAEALDVSRPSLYKFIKDHSIDLK